MVKRLSYVDAVKLLGDKRSPFVELVDKLTAGALIAGAATGHVQALAFFELRSEAMRLGADLIAKVKKDLARHTRESQSERLIAAHAVLVVTAFFEALDEKTTLIDIASLRLVRSEEISIAGGTRDALASLTSQLASVPAPFPSPGRPYEVVLEELDSYYVRLTDNTLEFLYGLAIIERLGETRLDHIRESWHGISNLAKIKYQDQFLRLAVDCPQFFLWANLRDHQATRAAIKRLERETANRLKDLYNIVDKLRTGLAGIEILSHVTGTANVDYARSELAITGRQELNWVWLRWSDCRLTANYRFDA
jgi:hypothetical protein